MARWLPPSAEPEDAAAWARVHAAHATPLPHADAWNAPPLQHTARVLARHEHLRTPEPYPLEPAEQQYLQRQLTRRQHAKLLQRVSAALPASVLASVQHGWSWLRAAADAVLPQLSSTASDGTELQALQGLRAALEARPPIAPTRVEHACSGLDRVQHAVQPALDAEDGVDECAAPGGDGSLLEPVEAVLGTVVQHALQSSPGDGEGWRDAWHFRTHDTS